MFLEAKKVYETYLDEIYKLEAEGVGDSLSPELEAILSDKGVEVTFKGYSEAKKRKHRVLPLEKPYPDTQIKAERSADGQQITVYGCADISAWRFTDSIDDKLIPGHIRRDRFVMERIDGDLIVIEVESDQVESCHV
ncbi:hypothetical protein [Cutibacterium sp.]|uniref:hypothetical protein n=1 Tax=Cutibacterium sp. TaxID=1912221 RepID=UPI0026DD8C60|nr:hypothetical protein [Cutibacterium sp.]MDO4413142.1 hypothetical protein [Cutibacterium sp.]